MTSRRLIDFGKALFRVGFFGIITALYGAFQFLFDGGSLATNIKLLGSFACFGFLLGGIFVFDSEHNPSNRKYSWYRTVIGMISGTAVAVIWGWSISWICFAGISSGLGGWLGIIWAKHVNF